MKGQLTPADYDISSLVCTFIPFLYIPHLLGLPAAKKNKIPSNNDFPAFYLFSHELFVMNRGLVRIRSCDFQLSPIFICFPNVDFDGAPRYCHLIFPHRCCTISSFLLSLQTELKNKSKMRAILQAISLPSQSIKKNIESAEKHYQSKFILSPSVLDLDH